MKYFEAPESVNIHDNVCPKWSNCGKAMYVLKAWPFNFRIAAGETMWRWSIDGLGTSDAGGVNFTTDQHANLLEAIEQAEQAAGQLVRQLLEFMRYGEH